MQAVMEAHESLQQLIRRAQKGDRDAFDALIRAHEAELKKHARVRIGEHLKSKVEVEDVVQETFARAWQSIASFQWTGEGAFVAWLKGIVEHVILKLVSRHSKERIIYRAEDRTSDAPTPSKDI